MGGVTGLGVRKAVWKSSATGYKCQLDYLLEERLGRRSSWLCPLTSIPGAHMKLSCPRCDRVNPSVARYCGRCGLALAVGAGDGNGVRHARPAERPVPPDGFVACPNSEALHYCCESESGGRPLLWTESLIVRLFNSGPTLRGLSVRVVGVGEDGREVFSVVREADVLGHGEERPVSVASYEVPEPIDRIMVLLQTADVSPSTDAG